MPVGTPHVAKIAIHWTYIDELTTGLNVVYVEDDTDAIFANVGAFVAQVDSAITSALVPATYDNLRYDNVEFQDVRTVPFGGTIIGVGPHAGALATGTNGIASSLSLAVQKLTGNLGRAGRGRWYWPLVSKADMSKSGEVSSAAATRITGALQAFQDALEGGSFPCKVGIVSYTLNKVPRAAGVFQQVIDWKTTDLFVDSQRRRLPGRGS